MNFQPTAQPQSKPIYQCDDHLHHTLKSYREQLHQLCAHHVNQRVMVETMDGDVFEGHIVHCERGVLFLQLANDGHTRGFFPGYANPYSSTILPLVLFNLLTISLLF
ncbi:hypothetical protein [Paenibacillus sp. GCM10027626]|uniref:hypothetical protein n=1 Tax=Paenibacillus sp. GCM10027626 TaxID=3273411 RepID=UPI00362D0D88